MSHQWTLRTTSLPVYSNLSQKAVAKEDYSVHSAIFVIAHTALGAEGEEAVSALVSSAAVAPGHKGRIVTVTVSMQWQQAAVTQTPSNVEKRWNNGILLYLLVLLLHCAPSSMELFLVLQLVFSQTPQGENGQLSLQYSIYLFIYLSYLSICLSILPSVCNFHSGLRLK